MKELSSDQFRIIDANINRLGEGLRVLEEFARMTLNDAVLTQKLKDMRHQMVVTNTGLYNQLVKSRDAAGDIGSDMEVSSESNKREPQGIIAANAKRAQESLRVLEEMAKIPALDLDSERYRKSRFELYTIEKELVARVSRKDKLESLKGVYVIIDAAWLKERKTSDIARQAIMGGAGVIQLRCKECSHREFLKMAGDIQEVCREKGVLFIVNDSLEIAMAVKADGLHAGQEDMPAGELKKLLPIDMILGYSARTVEEAREAFKEGADYLGVGAMFATATKESAEVVGPERVSRIKKVVDLPVVAIGGINKGNIKEVMKAGAEAAAVISAVMGEDDIEKATRELVNIVRGAKGG
ncbi:MAG: thiamine phosphate synthase [Dehalococcoidales bacterium]|nr:thiamine phosphate synthase [Dehalococcoidales bacterium]